MCQLFQGFLFVSFGGFVFKTQVSRVWWQVLMLARLAPSVQLLLICDTERWEPTQSWVSCQQFTVEDTDREQVVNQLTLQFNCFSLVRGSMRQERGSEVHLNCPLEITEAQLLFPWGLG